MGWEFLLIGNLMFFELTKKEKILLNTNTLSEFIQKYSKHLYHIWGSKLLSNEEINQIKKDLCMDPSKGFGC